MMLPFVLKNIEASFMFFTHLFVSLHCNSLQDIAILRKMDGKMSFKLCMSAWRKESCKNVGFAGFCSKKGVFRVKTTKKCRFFKKKLENVL